MMLAEVRDAAREAAASVGDPAARIRALLMTLHRNHRERMLAERQVHEMVSVAMTENWPAVDEFLDECADMLAALIAEGQARGDFGPGDARELGGATLHACAGILHPMLIAMCPEDELDQHAVGAVAFALRALENKEATEPLGCHPIDPEPMR
jgi:hypothetical protein